MSNVGFANLNDVLSLIAMRMDSLLIFIVLGEDEAAVI